MNFNAAQGTLVDARGDGQHHDVSVILNIHREAAYLRPTLMSLSQCSRAAKKHGIRCQLVAVFDRSDQDTINAFGTVDLGCFDDVKTIHIDAGSLGPARNAGISIADGDYIWTCDADDLVSQNCLLEMFTLARGRGDDKLAVFCEYCIGFGDRYFVVRYENSALLCPADIAAVHPYVSRIFLKRDVFEDLQYRDLKISAGFAYEDWDLNVRLLARGFRFEVAPQTAFFYRQRAGSLIGLAQTHSSGLIPHSEFFEPDHYLSAMSATRTERGNWKRLTGLRRDLRKSEPSLEIVNLPKLRQAIIDASRLDPEVNPVQIEAASSYFPYSIEIDRWGLALETAFELVGNRKFSDIVLLPWLLPGGAEKHMIEVVNALVRCGAADHVLFLTGQATSSASWRDRLDGKFIFLDLFNAFPEIDADGLSWLTARLLLAVGRRGARVHIKSSEFTHRLMDRYGGALSEDLSLVYFRFCDGQYAWKGQLVDDEFGIRFLRKHSSRLSKLISDCNQMVAKDLDVLPALTGKRYCNYALCHLPPGTSRAGASPTHRLVWASRLSAQKRPELIVMIARALSRRMPSVVIDVYGEPDEGVVPRTVVNASNVEYRGPFDGFENIPVGSYDALLYTSVFDGLPNVLLEAMACGLSVIAPAVGGIPEAVSAETGYLVANMTDDTALVDGYVCAIIALYADWPATLKKREAAAQLVERRHGPDSFIESLRLVFDLPAESVGVSHRPRNVKINVDA